MTPLRVALIHNLKPSHRREETPPDYYSECDSPKTVSGIVKALESQGHTVLPVEADRNLPQWLAQHPVDLAFNIAEGFCGQAREARVPALLELLGIPYTGSGVLALALALDKCRSKQVFLAAGVPTPKFQLFHSAQQPPEPRLHYPLIVKPNCEGSAKGIWASSVVQEEEALRAQVKKVMALYHQEALVEEFIEGTELTVGLLGKDQLLPVLEIDFSDCQPSGESFYSWRMKEFQGNKEMFLNPKFWCPARLDAAATQAVQQVALKAAKALGTRDLARVDIRLSCDGIPYVLEVNPLPGLDPEESNFPIMAQAAGIPYAKLICGLVASALARSLNETRSSIPLSEATETVPKPFPSEEVLPASGGNGGFGSPGDWASTVPAEGRKEKDLER